MKGKINMIIELDENKKLKEEYFKLKERYKNYYILCHNGNFYEVYGEDAKPVSKVTKTKVSKKGDFTGIPLQNMRKAIKDLIDADFKIILIKQLDEGKKKKIKRVVECILDRFNYIDNEDLDDILQHNVVSIYYDGKLGMCTYDLATGDMEIFNIDSLQKLKDELFKIDAKCIRANKDLELSAYYNYLKNEYENELELEEEEKYDIKLLKSMVSDEITEKEVNKIACGYLLKYLKDTNTTETEIESLNINKSISKKELYLDGTVVKNLELIRNLNKGTVENTLYAVMDKTQTAMGKRKLKEWILKPSMDIQEINNRLDIVEKLINSSLTGELRNKLRNISDVDKYLLKISKGIFSLIDAQNLKVSLLSIKDFNSISEYKIELSSIKEILNYLEENININSDDYLNTLNRDNLEKAYEFRHEFLNKLSEIEKKEKMIVGDKSVKISNNASGYYLSLSKSKKITIPDYYTVIKKDEYITKELKELNEAKVESDELIREEEYKVLTKLKGLMRLKQSEIKELSNDIAYIDLLINFAHISKENGYKCKPKMTDGFDLDIKEGRHPVVEKKVNNFIPNDIEFNENKKLHFITGPNMSGKSTYMRQTALICIMAHIGCFVPADKAEISILDRIFTRIGASDDLSNGRSTFMVEMDELAIITNYATNKSLLVLDEVGRGTSVEDGMSIAEATIEYIVNTLGSKAIFSTHYHELGKLEGKYDGINNCYIKVKEHNEEDIEFSHKVVQGGVEKSYGIRIAKLAGVKKCIIQRANEIKNNKN